jgi:hypothetical protein
MKNSGSRRSPRQLLFTWLNGGHPVYGSRLWFTGGAFAEVPIDAPALAPGNPDRAEDSKKTDVSIGIQSGPLIGVQKGPLWRDVSWPEAA